MWLRLERRGAHSVHRLVRLQHIERSRLFRGVFSCTSWAKLYPIADAVLDKAPTALLGVFGASRFLVASQRTAALAGVAF